MDSRNEILSKLREAKGILGDGADFRVKEAFEILEGLAPFLQKDTIIGMKCKNCDNYASSYFALSNDFCMVDENEYCHAKEASLKNIAALKMASCSQYNNKSREDLDDLAKAVIKEDLEPAFHERKLYDRSVFASYSVAFRSHTSPGKSVIEFGRKTEKGFVCSDIRLHILKRLDPGFEAQSSQKISESLKNGPVLAVEASPATRKQQDIDYMLEWIAKKRKMDIVYL